MRHEIECLFRTRKDITTNYKFKKPQIQQTTNTTSHKYNKPQIQKTTNTTNHKYNKPQIQQTTNTTNTTELNRLT